MIMINDKAIQVDASQAEPVATSGNPMGPIDTYRSAPLSSPNKRAFPTDRTRHCFCCKYTISEYSYQSSIVRYGNGTLTYPVCPECGYRGKWIADVICGDRAPYPIIDEGILRIWGLRRYEVGGAEVIGWEVGMEPA